MEFQVLRRAAEPGAGSGQGYGARAGLDRSGMAGSTRLSRGQGGVSELPGSGTQVEAAVRLSCEYDSASQSVTLSLASPVDPFFLFEQRLTAPEFEALASQGGGTGLAGLHISSLPDVLRDDIVPTLHAHPLAAPAGTDIAILETGEGGAQLSFVSVRAHMRVPFLSLSFRRASDREVALNVARLAQALERRLSEEIQRFQKETLSARAGTEARERLVEDQAAEIQRLRAELESERRARDREVREARAAAESAEAARAGLERRQKDLEGLAAARADTRRQEAETSAREISRLRAQLEDAQREAADAQARLQREIADKDAEILGLKQEAESLRSRVRKLEDGLQEVLRPRPSPAMQVRFQGLREGDGWERRGAQPEVPDPSRARPAELDAMLLKYSTREGPYASMMSRSMRAAQGAQEAREGQETRGAREADGHGGREVATGATPASSSFAPPPAPLYAPTESQSQFMTRGSGQARPSFSNSTQDIMARLRNLESRRPVSRGPAARAGPHTEDPEASLALSSMNTSAAPGAAGGSRIDDSTAEILKKYAPRRGYNELPGSLGVSAATRGLLERHMPRK